MSKLYSLVNNFTSFRLIDSLTSTLASLHVLTVVNHLHASCVGKVQDANILKKDESLSYWSQVIILSCSS